MDLVHVILQDGVPVLVVGLAAAWLIRRQVRQWTRPSQSPCSKCDAATPKRVAVRHRLPVLGARE